MGCGNGKTVMALFIAAKLGRRTMVVVHKEFLMNQWRERIRQFLPGASVGKIQGPVFDVDHDIVLCMLQTLCVRDLDAARLAGFGLVIVDECHHTSAQAFSKALHKVNFRYSLGLTATIQRKDGLGYIFQWFLGDVCHRARQESQSVQIQLLRFSSRDPAYSEELFIYGGKVNMARMVSNICAFKPRTGYIVAELVNTLDARGVDGNNCKALVLSERRNHLIEIERELKRVRPEITVGYYVGGLSETQLKESEMCSVILGTFAMAAEGMDIPSLDTLLLASPKSDIEQSAGRILRLKQSDRRNVPLILDLVDDFSVFRSMSNKRKKYYKKKGYRVVNESERE